MSTTASAGEAKPVSSAPAKAAPQVQVAAPSRREFLYYIWGASMALLLGEAGAGLIWFALPRFKEGTFGGTFNLAGDTLPQAGSAPVNVPEGRFWLSNSDAGFVVLYGVCTHLGCLPKWVDVNNRFECPCHGSKYEIDGKYIEGPAPRSLDRFRTTITFTDGTSETMNRDGDPINLAGRTIASIAVDTGTRLKRNGKV
ncbi:MAG: Rieske 2Fe-2S domain-containing protein [Anaerolineae bacterium]|jgi:cytochrome b6-f complex iron-sulfur subunit|uniref:QcrA and Rieske domain-containing protein n=1 Tax=Candidatus Flexifilum breve TaxID=3140694 RepID=UPI001AC9FAE7|nr:Rieske 2Fe-2S domain-containing protein [Chloroflexota bacterium]MBK9750170.1 Rieske 2Fe-2S domain-containing protein [Chloroflexota bacterium]MBN8637056.1 Rieske 2Fe-2S domain-containing protein [Anaerolineae bacterium]